MCMICEKCGAMTPLDLPAIPTEMMLEELARRRPIQESNVNKQEGDEVILKWIRENIPAMGTFYYSDIPTDIIAARFFGPTAYQKLALWLVHQSRRKDSGFSCGGRSNGKTIFVRM